MIHYIYKITFLRGYPCGRYYLGKRSFGGADLSKDNYSGSGAFCKAYFKAYGKILGDTYLKEIIEINPSSKINRVREIEIIGDKYKTDPLCMNQMQGGGGGNNCTAKVILQYDLNGELVGVHDSECKAAQAIGLTTSSSISKACINKTTTCCKYIWRFAEEPLSKSELLNIQMHSKPVNQYSEDGTFIKQWESAKIAGNELNIDPTSIIAICRHTNKNRHSCGGFVWSYYNEKPQYNKIIPYIGERKVIKYDKFGKQLEEFVSLKQAADSVKGKWQCIQNCCNNKTNQAYGFIWRFKGDALTREAIELAKKSLRKFKIQQLDDNGKILNEYNGPTEACKQFNGRYQDIQWAIKRNKKKYGYYWRKVEIID